MRISFAFLLIMIFGACGERKGAQDISAPVAADVSENQLLYNEVMEVHDAVMPGMDEIYRLKQSLRSRLDVASADEKLRIEQVVQKLDSADDGMMDWMHKFQPLPDSLGEEKARAYLENEMTRIKKVKADMERAIELAREVASDTVSTQTKQ